MEVDASTDHCLEYFVDAFTSFAPPTLWPFALFLVCALTGTSSSVLHLHSRPALLSLCSSCIPLFVYLEDVVVPIHYAESSGHNVY